MIIFEKRAHSKLEINKQYRKYKYNSLLLNAEDQYTKINEERDHSFDLRIHYLTILNLENKINVQGCPPGVAGNQPEGFGVFD
jgi:hypothetical protein